MSIRSLKITATAIAVGLAPALAMSSAALAQVPRVAADIAPVQGLAARVMQGVGVPDLIVRPGATPHGYSLRPSEAGALQAADVVFWIGAELTPWLARSLDTLAPQAHHVALLHRKETQTLDVRSSAAFTDHDAGHGATDDEARHEHEHEHEDDHAQEHGHTHEGIDPHAWMDPENGKAWLGVIAAELSRRDPENADIYQANADAAAQEIDAVRAEVVASLAPLHDMDFIVFHDAYQYFETRFDMFAAGAISLSDAADPSPARVADIRDLVAERGIDCAFAEPQFDPGILRAVFTGTETRTAVIDPMGTRIATGPGFYAAYLRAIAEAFAECR